MCTFNILVNLNILDLHMAMNSMTSMHAAIHGAVVNTSKVTRSELIHLT